MVATLFTSAISFTLGAQQSYDAWGVVRSGAATGEPNARYCANLGHLSDDESGLTYMRARYYEASSGRFISEDPSWSGINWYSYSGNIPVSYGDMTGNSRDDLDNPLREALYRGLISKAFYQSAMKNGKLREFLKRLIEDTKKGFGNPKDVPDNELLDILEYESEKFETGVDLGGVLGETDAELLQDMLESGEDILLEEEVFIREEAGG